MENSSIQTQKKIILPLSFYKREDVIQIAKDLLGKEIFTNFHGHTTSGIIVETECYRGIDDKASHAYNNRRTKRTEIMYACGGVIYVYLCYGMHYLLNIVTNKQDIPHAVLIRAIEPTSGISIMQKRRNKAQIDYTLTNGPGALSQALGIKSSHNGLSLTKSSDIWIKENQMIPAEQIICSARIGVAYALADALLPWRFRIKGSHWTSIAK